MEFDMEAHSLPKSEEETRYEYRQGIMMINHTKLPHSPSPTRAHTNDKWQWYHNIQSSLSRPTQTLSLIHI